MRTARPNSPDWTRADLIRGMSRLSAVLLAVAVHLLASACAAEDPLARRLAQRTHFQVSVLSFIPREDGTLLVELQVGTVMSTRLETLTVTVRQHGEDEQVLRQDRLPLDLREMDATGVVRLFRKIPAYPDSEVLSLTVTLEVDPPASEYGDFPEIEALADL